MSGILQVPLFDDEILPSYLSRLANANGRTANLFVRDFGIKYPKIQRGDIHALENLSRICGEPKERLQRHALVIGVRHETTLLGATFIARGLIRRGIRYCPDCLREDDSDITRIPGTRRYQRGVWLLKDVNTCAHHALALQSIDTPRYAHYDLSSLLNSNAIAANEVLIRPLSVPPTRIEVFAHDRLQGVRNHGDLLDSIDLSVAIDFARLLGVALLHGKHEQISRLDPVELETAAQEGFRYLEGGREALIRALDTVIDQSEKPPMGIDGAYAKLGKAIFQTRVTAEYDPVKVWLTECADARIRRRWVGKVFDVEGENNQPPTYDKISRETGLSRSTITRKLNARGLQSGTVSHSQMAKIKRVLQNPDERPIPGKDAAAIIGCRPWLFSKLVEEGVVKPLVVHSLEDGEPLPGRPVYSELAAVKLRQDLVSSATSEVVSGMIPLRYAPAATGLSQAAIIAAILRGDIKRVALDDAQQLSRGLYINPYGLGVLENADSHFNAHEIVKLLHISRKTLTALMKMGVFTVALDAKPNVALRSKLIPRKEVENFRKRFVTVGELEKSTGISRNYLALDMKAKGVAPAFPQKEVDALFVPRKHLARLLERTDDSYKRTRAPIKRGGRRKRHSTTACDEGISLD